MCVAPGLCQLPQRPSARRKGRGGGGGRHTGRIIIIQDPVHRAAIPPLPEAKTMGHPPAHPPAHCSRPRRSPRPPAAAARPQEPRPAAAAAALPRAAEPAPRHRRLPGQPVGIVSHRCRCRQRKARQASRAVLKGGGDGERVRPQVVSWGKPICTASRTTWPHLATWSAASGRAGVGIRVGAQTLIRVGPRAWRGWVPLTHGGRQAGA